MVISSFKHIFFTKSVNFSCLVFKETKMQSLFLVILTHRGLCEMMNSHSKILKLAESGNYQLYKGYHFQFFISRWYQVYHFTFSKKKWQNNQQWWHGINLWLLVKKYRPCFAESMRWVFNMLTSSGLKKTSAPIGEKKCNSTLFMKLWQTYRSTNRPTNRQAVGAIGKLPFQ